jgi:hypothetical protein
MKNESRKPVIGIRVETGFHQVKKFVYSGLAEQLCQSYQILWIAPNNVSAELKLTFEPFGEFLLIDEKTLRQRSKVESYHRRIRESWLLQSGMSLFRLYGQSRKKKLTDTLLGLNGLRIVADNLILQVVSSYYVHDDLISKLKEKNVSTLITTSYNSIVSKVFFVCGEKTGIPVVLMINSWKDVFVNSFVPFKGFKDIWVWDNQMKQNILDRNPHLSNIQFYTTGNPSFDQLKIHEPKFSKEHYAQKYKANINRPWVYVTLAPPGVFDDEIRVFIKIAESFLAHQIEVEFFVRRNPNHNETDFQDLKMPQNLRLTEHLIYYDEAKDEIIQPLEDESEWLDLLHYTSFNISLPSTVTLEFLALNKRVINYEFNFDDKLNLGVRSFFESGFYAPLFENSKLVHRAMSMNSLLELSREIIQEDTSPTPDQKLSVDVIIKRLHTWL